MAEAFVPGSSRAALIRRIRLITGLILLVYVATHLVNHAYGLAGLPAAESGLVWFLALWRNPIGTALLYGSLAIHALLALWGIYQRRHLRMPPWEATQILVGLAIPPLLAVHAVETRIAHDLFGVTDSYTRVLLSYWLDRPVAARQLTLLVVAWLHGCAGLHFWLRLRPWYGRALPTLSVFALLLPVLAVLGIFEAMRDIDALAAQPGWVATALAAAHQPDGAGRQALADTARIATLVSAATLVVTLLARLARQIYERRRKSIRVSYPLGRRVVAPVGLTLLEISRLGAIPHASVCGARGRCSTCRVRVVRGLAELPPAEADEIAVLTRVGATEDIRLACQLRPVSDLTVIPLLPATAGARDVAGVARYVHGDEREICVLFADLRGFTRFSETKLPYDVVFFLNRYFDTMGRAIERAGGVTNQFTGDGVMALFGLDSGPEQGSRDAISAAQAMVRGLAELSAELVEELSEPLRIGIGIHAGPAVVGRMGRGVAMYLTAVGDTVQIASRLQDLTKQYDCQAIVSEATAARAGLDVAELPRHEITVRNRSQSIAIRTFDDIGALPAQAASAGA